MSHFKEKARYIFFFILKYTSHLSFELNLFYIKSNRFTFRKYRDKLEFCLEQYIVYLLSTLSVSNDLYESRDTEILGQTVYFPCLERNGKVLQI